MSVYPPKEEDAKGEDDPQGDDDQTRPQDRHALLWRHRLSVAPVAAVFAGNGDVIVHRGWRCYDKTVRGGAREVGRVPHSCHRRRLQGKRIAREKCFESTLYDKIGLKKKQNKKPTESFTWVSDVPAMAVDVAAVESQW